MTQSYFKNIEDRIIKDIYASNESIKIAVAWFTNLKIYNALLSKIKKGIEVEIIIRNDYINNSKISLNWSKFIDEGGVLYFYNPSENFHHKFFIVDESLVTTGSYNWTYHAEKRNKENIVILIEEMEILSFTSEFDNLKTSSVTANSKTVNIIPLSEAPKFEVEYLDKELNEFNNIESNFIQASIEYNKKNYSRSIKILNSILKINNQDKQALFLLGWNKFRLNDYKDALTKAKKAVELGLSEPDCFNLIGCCFTNLEDYKTAIDYFDQSIKIDPKTSVWYKNKIKALDCRGSTSNADKVELELKRVCSEIIKDKANKNSYKLMKACMDYSETLINRDFQAQLKYAEKAKDIFENQDEVNKDYHDFDGILFLMKNPNAF